MHEQAVHRAAPGGKDDEESYCSMSRLYKIGEVRSHQPRTMGAGAGVPEPWALLLLLCAFALPVLVTTVTPLTDLPGHLGRYRVQLDLHTSPYFHRWYDFHWRLVPNLGVDLFVQLLAPKIGLEPSVKLIAALIPPITAGGFLWTSKEAHGGVPPTTYFALPLAYNYAFQFGFLNFCLAMGLAFVAFAFWLRLTRQDRTLLRSALFLPVGLVLWLVHIYGWATLLLLCFAAELSRARNNPELRLPWRASLMRAAMSVIPICAPALLSIAWQVQGGSPTSRWFALDVTAGWLIGILRDRWIVWDIASAALLFALITAAVVMRRRFRWEPQLAYGAAGLWLTGLVLPQKLFGSGYAAARLVPYAVALALLAMRPRASLPAAARRRLVYAGLGFCAARLVAGLISYALYSRTLEGELAALNSLPQGSTVVAFVESGCDAWANPRTAHLPSYAIARRSSFSNDQWQTNGGQLLTVTYDKAGAFKSDPSSAVEDNVACAPHPPRFTSVLPHVPWLAFDYLWLIDVPKQLWPRAATLRPVWQNRNSVLFRIGHSKVPESSSGGAQRVLQFW